jgi:hypothetical protein
MYRQRKIAQHPAGIFYGKGLIFQPAALYKFFIMQQQCMLMAATATK